MKNKSKVLIVDDEPAMREVIGLILSSYYTVGAANGYEALKLCEEVRPDIVLMDIMMPRMNGIEATKAILKKNPETKIIAITAYASNKGKEIIDAGAVELLEKPFRRRQLEELVEKVANGNLERIHEKPVS